MSWVVVCMCGYIRELGDRHFEIFYMCVSGVEVRFGLMKKNRYETFVLLYLGLNY